jgi:acyl carrier protein
MSTQGSREALRKEIFALLAEVTGGSLTSDHIAADTEFTETGMSSIEYLALVEKIETTFDVVIHLEDGSLTSVDSFLNDLLKQQATASRP